MPSPWLLLFLLLPLLPIILFLLLLDRRGTCGNGGVPRARGKGHGEVDDGAVRETRPRQHERRTQHVAVAEHAQCDVLRRAGCGPQRDVEQVCARGDREDLADAGDVRGRVRGDEGADLARREAVAALHGALQAHDAPVGGAHAPAQLQLREQVARTRHLCAARAEKQRRVVLELQQAPHLHPQVVLRGCVGACSGCQLRLGFAHLRCLGVHGGTQRVARRLALHAAASVLHTQALQARQCPLRSLSCCSCCCFCHLGVQKGVEKKKWSSRLLKQKKTKLDSENVLSSECRHSRVSWFHRQFTLTNKHCHCRCVHM